MSNNKSMFSDEDWSRILSFLGHDFINDPELQKQRLAEFELSIDKNRIERLQHSDQSNDYDLALSILIQGYNIIAKVAGVPEKIFKTISEPSARQNKKIALFVPGFKGVMIKALEQHFRIANLSDLSIFEIYNHTSNLVTDILDGKISGVVHISLRTSNFDGSATASLQHDLKNRDGWNYELANSYIFPPILDFSFLDMINALSHIPLLHAGAVYTNANPSSFEEVISRLIPEMVTLEITVNVMVVDDHYSEVEEMCKILKAWPKVNVIFKDASSFSSAAEAITNLNLAELFGELPTVLLLDEDMGKFTGSEVVKSFPNIVSVSITGGEKPSWASVHFQGKTQILSNPNIAKDLVSFMNSVFSKIGVV